MEAGSHSELLAAGGKYAELWARQQAHVDEIYDSGSEEMVHEEEGGPAGSAAGTAGAEGAAAAAQGGGDTSVQPALNAAGEVSPTARGGAGLGGDVPSGTS